MKGEEKIVYHVVEQFIFGWVPMVYSNAHEVWKNKAKWDSSSLALLGIMTIYLLCISWGFYFEATAFKF